jgi:hypothetical protein
MPKANPRTMILVVQLYSFVLEKFHFEFQLQTSSSDVYLRYLFPLSFQEETISETQCKV